jgi:hypothetical protein
MNRIVIAVVGPQEKATMQRLHGLGRHLLQHVREAITKMEAAGLCQPGELLVGENSVMVHLEVGGMNKPKLDPEKAKNGGKKPTV